MKNIKNKAQMFSLDLLFGFFLFVFIFLMLEGAWISTREKSNNQEDINELQILSDSLAQNLLSGSGYPKGWEDLEINSSSVEAIGIAISPNLLSTEKILALQSQNDVIYDDLKEILGINGPGYEFYVEVRYLGPGGLFGLNPVIAYTFGNSYDYAEEGNAEHFGIRDYLDTNEIEYTNYMEDWQTLIEEIDNYNVVIFEDPDIDFMDTKVVSTEQKNKVKEWVENGENLLLHKERGDLATIFEMTYNKKESDNVSGNVVRTDDILQNVEIGDKIECNEGYRIKKQNEQATMLVSDNSGHGIIAYANISKGRFLYLCDTEGNVLFGESGPVKHDNVREIINFGGGVLSYKFGLKPTDYDIISRTERIVSLDTNTTANMIVMVWKRK